MTAPVATLALYLAGDSPAPRRARTNPPALHITLPVRMVDVLAEPDEALAPRICVTPALPLRLAGQREMLVGDLSQTGAMCMALAPLAPSAPHTLHRPGDPA